MNEIKNDIRSALLVAIVGALAGIASIVTWSMWRSLIELSICLTDWASEREEV